MLIGNTYPTSLIRRKATFIPVTQEQAKQYLGFEREVESFWGHPNTIKAASEMLGMDITPKEERPTITLSENYLPTLYGKEHKSVLIVSANIPNANRKPRNDPTEYELEEIESWSFIVVTFPL